MRLLDVLELEDLLDRDLERAVLELRQRMVNQLIPQLALVVLVPAAQTATLEPNPLLDKVAQIRSSRRNRTTQRRQIHDPAVSRRRLQIPGKVAGADEVDDDVHTLAVRVLEHLLLPMPIAFLVAEPLIGPETLAKVDLLAAAGGDEHLAGAVGLAELDAGDADGAGARVPQHRIPRLEVADHPQRLGGGDPCLRDAGACFPRELRRLVDEHVCRDGDVLGVGAAVGQTEDVVAALEAAFVVGAAE